MQMTILQNGRKKLKQNSGQRLANYLKLRGKSSLPSTMGRSTVLASQKLQDRLEQSKQQHIRICRKQNINPNQMTFKLKNNLSYANLIANSCSTTGTFLRNAANGQAVKRMGNKNSYSLAKPSRQKNIQVEQKQKEDKKQEKREKDEKKLSYFFRILMKKNKLRSEFNIIIHNSIMTFKEFSRACLIANPKPADLRIPQEKENRKTIVFDMDETLIHTNEIATPNYEIKVPFCLIQQRVGYGFVDVRPHCKQVLKRLSQHFDIIIFTASTQGYADPIINHIDPDKVIQHRLYRQSCSFIRNQIFVKDLRVLGRKLQNVVLVDNAPYSYLMQLDNAIPIVSYFRGKDDQQLLHLEKYLMKLKDVDDVRTINKQYFKLHQYAKFESYQKLINKLYGEWFK